MTVLMILLIGFGMIVGVFVFALTLILCGQVCFRTADFLIEKLGL